MSPDRDVSFIELSCGCRFYHSRSRDKKEGVQAVYCNRHDSLEIDSNRNPFLVPTSEYEIDQAIDAVNEKNYPLANNLGVGGRVCVRDPSSPLYHGQCGVLKHVDYQEQLGWVLLDNDQKQHVVLRLVHLWPENDIPF